MRGRKVPSFYLTMSLKNTVEELVAGALQENPSLFLIDLKVHPDNRIEVIIDGDQGVTVDDCIAVSRAVEHNLDREEQDFALQVMSAGVSEGITHQRQYQKNVGRKLKVKTAEDKVEGELVSVTDDGITLVWKTREPKPVGKGKVTVTKEANIAFKDIREAKVMITF
ncbi:ribosome assembly cofactor RimP [Aquimarina brevivitae]|uniref:Ribosome maturation factor RimP n=1 Tax=Aquimarina brevivitae TaxID=323412 RepID=A0A4Q7PGJ9_9FLAO|nr:ribosome assembly cofactor RimP [Aquimarina brevivitae]RZS98880.1 ribosome maturation factor RimP [Aquimarina brevivitae]